MIWTNFSHLKINAPVQSRKSGKKKDINYLSWKNMKAAELGTFWRDWTD